MLKNRTKFFKKADRQTAKKEYNIIKGKFGKKFLYSDLESDLK